MSSDYKIPKGALILVTGATGLVGGTVSEELLKRGYRVRGTTRDAANAKAIAEKFETLYGKGVFEVAEIKDYTISGAYNTVLQDVQGIVHTITDGSFSPDIDKTVSTTRKYTLDILDAARQSPKVVSVVLTSSCHAGTTKPYPDGGPISVSNDSFAEYAWPQGKAITDDNPMMKGLLGYIASKGESERAAWEWHKENKPSFALNTVLPVVVLGAPPNPAISTPTTVGQAYKLFSGDPTSALLGLGNPSLPMVDVRDAAVLHVAALLAADVKSERIWAFGHAVHLNEILQIWRDAFPDKKDNIPADMDYQFQTAEIPGRSRSKELLSRFAGRDWISVKDTVIDSIPQN